MKRLRRLLACLCAAALVMALALSAAASEESVYQMAVNDRFVDMSAEAMPFQSDGVLYVPYTLFDGNVTGVALGVSFSVMRDDSGYYLYMYRIGGTLRFDLNAGTCTDQNTGESMGMRAIIRNGTIFLPLNRVSRYCELTTSQRLTPYGTFLRLTNGKESLSTQEFLEVAMVSGRLQNRYNDYIRSLSPSASVPAVTTAPGQTVPPAPTPGGAETPDRNGVRLYLAFQCTDGSGLEAILDTLDRSGVRALFLFRPEDLAGRGDQVRRVVGSGHAVGLLLPGGDLDAVQASLSQGSALLERIARLRIHTAALEQNDGQVLRWLTQLGWACWTGNVDGLDDGRGQAAQANAILAAAAERGSVRITLDDGAAGAGILSRILPRLQQAGYSIRLAVESEL